MMDLSKVSRYYIACGYTDLRLGIDGLAAVVTQQYGSALDEESLFLFCGRRTDRIKALYWSGDGYILLYKRLSNGRFQWPRSEAELRLLDPQSFRWLMEGLKVEQRTAIRKGKPKDLPVEEVVISLPESQLICEDCGGTFRLVGKKFIRREMVIIPQQEKILEYYSCTYACDKCEKDTGYAHIINTKTPPPLMKHSLASASTVADVMTKKYVDGLPLARQEKIWARQGVELSRATLANWVIQCSQSWLKPLYRHMKQQLLNESVIHADETVVQVLKEDGKAATSESRMWLYASGEHSKKSIRLFEYQPDRSGKRPEAFLKGFTGCLVTDGYAGYNQVTTAVHCGCWAHARRKWREAMPDGATVKTSKAAVGYNYCTKLFSAEKKCVYGDTKARQAHRQNVVWPLLEEYFCWLKTIHPEKGSKLEDAVRYSLNQKQQLMAFLDHWDVPISNNLAENAIRPFVVGRKNWLFCDSVKGAESSAIVYSLVETAKANNMDPYDYLLLVLSLLPYLGKDPAHEKLDTLMPWHPDVKYRKLRTLDNK